MRTVEVNEPHERCGADLLSLRNTARAVGRCVGACERMLEHACVHAGVETLEHACVDACVQTLEHACVIVLLYQGLNMHVRVAANSARGAVCYIVG